MYVIPVSTNAQNIRYGGKKLVIFERAFFSHFLDFTGKQLLYGRKLKILEEIFIKCFKLNQIYFLFVMPQRGSFSAPNSLIF